MAYTFSPTTIPATTEGTQLNQTITVVKDAFDPAITSLVVYKLEHTLGNIVVTTGASSFVITGQYQKNWDQTIFYEEYAKSGNTNVTVKQFANISSNLNFVIGYIANTSPSTLTANYAVKINNGANLYITQSVGSNFTPNKDSLISAVSQGKF